MSVKPYTHGTNSLENAQLQAALKKAAATEGVPAMDPGALDGDFGHQTTAAVIAAQQHWSLVADGFVRGDLLVFLGLKTAPKLSNPLENPLVKIGLDIFLPQILKGLPMGNLINIFSGYKTYTASLAMILTGISDYIQPGIVPGSAGFPPLAWICAGIAFLGIRSSVATTLLALIEKFGGIDPNNLPK